MRLFQKKLTKNIEWNKTWDPNLHMRPIPTDLGHMSKEIDAKLVIGGLGLHSLNSKITSSFSKTVV